MENNTTSSKNISEGKLCPFRLVNLRDNFSIETGPLDCIGERCALFQTIDSLTPELDEEGKPKVVDGKLKVKLTQFSGCSLALGMQLQYYTEANVSELTSIGHRLLSGLARKSEILLPR